MKPLKQDMTGVILAGGENRRFGSQKALAKINGKRVIERIITEMKEVFSNNIIIVNDEELYREFNLKTYPDLVKGKGPLVGIYTALHHSSKDIFVTACDMPFVSASVIRKIVDRLKGYDAVIPKHSGKLHFLHAAYSLKCFDILKKKLAGGFLGLKDIVEDLNCNIIEEFKFEDDHLSPFFNMNTPHDFSLVKDHLNDL
jgi:molybdopterin-guanine dinucleotide biosynthesis protein A|tara:strand:- start:12623 stop:13219 length:597 start_codon:yes stop_codon:yes gene_type:complete